MANGTQYSWIPKNISSLDFPGNCYPASRWYSDFYRTQSPGLADYPLQRTVIVLAEGYKSYWKEHNISKPADREIMDWFYAETYDNDNPAIQYAIGNYTLKNCLKDFCGMTPWRGNSDQAGRGMLVTYSLEAALVTIYIFAIWIGKTGRMPADNGLRKYLMRRVLRRVQEAFRETLRVFLDAALVFCVAMLVAAIIDFGLTLTQSNKASTQSSIVMSGYVALFSVFPAIALHSCDSSQLRRSKVRDAVWAVIGLLTVVMETLEILTTWININRIYNDPLKAEEHDRQGQLSWELACLDYKALSDLNIALVSFFSILGAAVLLYLVLLAVLHLPVLKGNKFIPKIKSIWNIVATVFSMLAMWASFAIFAYYRRQLSKNAGDTNEDHEWTFGQVLALATFAPVFIEFGMILRKGPEDALTGLMSDRYRACKDVSPVMKKEENQSGMEQEQI